jgi:hypothetical protein
MDETVSDPTTALPALPLDDPRWAPLDDAAARLSPHLGGHSIAAHDLSGALTTNGLRCLNRHRARGGVWVRARVSLLCWAGYRLVPWVDGKLSIARRSDWPREGYSELDLKHRGDPRRDGVPFSQIGFGQGVLLGWQPDLERIWPAVFPAKEAGSITTSMPASMQEVVTVPISNSPPPKLRPLPKSIAKKLAGKRQMLRVALALWQEFPDGEAPRSMTGKECRRRLSQYWTGGKMPSPETCRRTMNLLGRSAD